jgi:hypothetical protein
MWVEENGIEPKCLIYLTCLCCNSFRSAPDYPLLWVTDSHNTAPFGETLRIRIVIDAVVSAGQSPLTHVKKAPGSAKALMSSESITLMVKSTCESEFCTMFCPKAVDVLGNHRIVDDLRLRLHYKVTRETFDVPGCQSSPRWRRLAA